MPVWRPVTFGSEMASARSRSSIGRAAVVSAGALVALASCGDGSAGSDVSSNGDLDGVVEVSGLDGVQVEVRRDPGCGCCVSWVDYLLKHGADVELSEDSARAEWRHELGVPDAVASCHTALIEGYAIEGHVPVEAIDRLLAERPDVVGISVAGMPALSPGMGGEPADWAQLEVVSIDHDGTTEQFQF